MVAVFFADESDLKEFKIDFDILYSILNQGCFDVNFPL